MISIGYYDFDWRHKIKVGGRHLEMNRLLSVPISIADEVNNYKKTRFE